MVQIPKTHVEITILTSELPTDMIKEKTDEFYQDQQRVIQLLIEKMARVQKEADNMAADFRKEREWLEYQQTQNESGWDRRFNFAAWRRAAVNMALPALGVVGALGYRFMFAAAPPPPPPPPPDVVAQVLAAVANLFK